MSREVVVLVPGLWIPSVSMAFLKWWLQRRCGLPARIFRYPTVRRSLADNAARLDRYIAGLRADRIHLVGHSLGGLVIRALFAYFPDQPPGRIVTLGTPHLGSAAAARLARLGLGRLALGLSIGDLLRAAPDWPCPPRECASLAGDAGVGLGRVVLPGLQRPHDGTVSVSETRWPGAAHTVVPVAHFAMPLSPAVAREVCHFLRSGRLNR